jgi:hypothetical protein
MLRTVALEVRVNLFVRCRALHLKTKRFLSSLPIMAACYGDLGRSPVRASQTELKTAGPL